MKQASFLDTPDDHGIRRSPAEPRPKRKAISAPLVQDGQAPVLGSLATGARYAARCLVCEAWLAVDETRYGVPICGACARKRGGRCNV